MTTQNKKTTVFLDPRALIEETLDEENSEDIEELEKVEKSVAFLISAINLLIFKPLIFMLIWNLTIPNLYSTVKPFNYLQSVGIFVMITMLRRTK
jgi:hypothetical protein